MSDLEWFRLLFAIAAGVWVSADAIFGYRYVKALWLARFRSPFIMGRCIVGLTCTYETLLYGYAVWFQDTNAALYRFIFFNIPILLIFQAVAFVLIANWIFTTRTDGVQTHIAT